MADGTNPEGSRNSSSHAIDGQLKQWLELRLEQGPIAVRQGAVGSLMTWIKETTITVFDHPAN